MSSKLIQKQVQVFTFYFTEQKHTRNSIKTQSQEVEFSFLSSSNHFLSTQKLQGANPRESFAHTEVKEDNL